MTKSFNDCINTLRRYGITLMSISESTPRYVVDNSGHYNSVWHSRMYDSRSLDTYMSTIPTFMADGFTQNDFEHIANALEFAEYPRHPTLRKAYDEYIILKKMIEGGHECS